MYAIYPEFGKKAEDTIVSTKYLDGMLEYVQSLEDKVMVLTEMNKVIESSLSNPLGISLLDLVDTYYAAKREGVIK